MKKVIFVLFLGSIGLMACNSGSKSDDQDAESFDEHIELSQLDSIRAVLQKEMPNVPVDTYRKAIAMHLQFAEHNPEDAFTPVALDYAQGYSEQIQDLRTSINIINRILKDYPDYEGKKLLMFSKATHHDFLRDVKEAIAAYEAYLKEFPNLAADERAEIENMIRLAPYSLEERIKMYDE